MTNKPPITNSAIPDEWIADTREAARVTEGVALRAHAALPRIEAFSINRNRWLPLMVPGSGFDFTDATERDAALARINAKGAV